MPDASPAHLESALALVGKLHDGQDVVVLAREIAQTFTDLTDYCSLAGPTTAWCGIFVARELSKLGIRPPYDPGNDVGSFMYVDAWAKTDWGGTRIERGQELPGDIIAFNAPHHVTILKEVQGNKFICVGGNQSDGVTIQAYATNDLMAIIRPPAPTGTRPAIITSTPSRPLIVLGSSGPHVTELQTRLGIAASGIFDEATDGAVRAYQRSRALDDDGEVGPKTWKALLGVAVAVADDVPHAAEYGDQWRRMVILPKHTADVDAISRNLLSFKRHYQAAQAQTGVPWFMIAVLHNRESDADFSTQLGNGDPLNEVSTHVPAGRGPFSTWQEGAFDALVTIKHLDKIKEWTLERIIYECERYNGFGYRGNGVPSAYLWSFSNIYQGGKYIKDGPSGWSPTTWDKQCGTMPLIKRMMELDASITFANKPLDGEILPPLKETDMDEKMIAAMTAAVTAGVMQQLEARGVVPALPKPPPPPAQPEFDLAALRPALEMLFGDKWAAMVPFLKPQLTGPGRVVDPPAVDPAKPVAPAASGGGDFLAKLLGFLGIGAAAVGEATGVMPLNSTAGTSVGLTGVLAAAAGLLNIVNPAWGGIANMVLGAVGGIRNRNAAK